MAFLEKRACPVCGASESAPWLRKGDMTLDRCGGCGMVFANPLPPEFVDSSFYETGGSAYYLSPDKLAADHSPVRYQREIALLRGVCPGGSLLDVGCGTGGFLEQLRGRYPGAYALAGFDVAGPALEHARGLGIEVHRGSLSGLLEQRRNFDAITLWAVLEHVPNPAETVATASRLLKPGGVLLALVPNLDSLAVRLLAGRYRYILPQHVNYFSGGTLRRLLIDAGGLGDVRVRGTHFNPLVIAQDFRRAGRLVPDADRARLLQRTNAYKRSASLRPVYWLYQGLEWGLAQVRLTDNVVAIGRKSGS